MCSSMDDKKFYTVPFVWDKTLWVLTSLIFVLYAGFSAWKLWEIFTLDDTSRSLAELLTFNAVMLPTMLICEGLAPQRLEIGAKKLVILRRYKSITISSKDVISVEHLPKNGLRGAVRTFGVGGLFGYFGSYYKAGIGAFKLYATSQDDLFLIRLVNGKNIVISCAEPEKMSHFSV